MKSDEIATIRAAHTIRDERLSALPPVLDRGAALRVLSEALESHRAATVLLDALEASQSREAALVAALVEAADGGADAIEALLNHYYRHTTHRCEIDREAEEALAAYRALLDQQPCRAAAPAVDEGQVEQCASICSAHQVRKAGCRLCHAVFRTPAAAGQGEG